MSARAAVTWVQLKTPKAVGGVTRNLEATAEGRADVSATLTPTGTTRAAVTWVQLKTPKAVGGVTRNLEATAEGRAEASAQLRVTGTRAFAATAVGGASVEAALGVTYYTPPPARFQYVTGEGATFDLYDDCKMMMGFGGVGLVGPEHMWAALPDRDGAEHMGARTPNRLMNFVVKGGASTRGSAWVQKGAFAEAFSIDKGRGYIKATLPDQTERRIRARYAGGVDFSTEDARTYYAQDFPVQFVGEESHWYDDDTQQQTTSFSGTLTCTNSGDVPVYPTFTVAAPVEHPVLSLSGSTIDVDVNVTSGSLVIDCATPAVRLNGASVMGSATPSSRFFELARGTNAITLSATSGTGQCKAEWKEKYRALVPA